MPDHFYEGQCTIPYWSALPTDVVTNTFHFRWANTSPPTTPDYVALETAIQTFYATIFTNTGGVQMAQYMRPANTRWKLYDLETAKPRVPVRNVALPLTVAQDTNPTLLPEAAICLSYSAEVISGDNAARRRGRIYLGGLGNSCEGLGNATATPIVTSNATTKGCAAMKALANLSLTYDWFWSVYSPTTNAQTGSISQSFNAITHGFVDNEFDTQRRRGRTAGSRMTWTLP